MNYEKNENFKEGELSEILNLLKNNEERIKAKDKLIREWAIDKIKNEKNKDRPNIFISILCLIIGLIFSYLFSVFCYKGQSFYDFLITIVSSVISLTSLFFPAKHFYYFLFSYFKEEKINLSDKDIDKYLLDLKYKKSN
ncbi:MAG: hypothetical protein AM1032_000162 [Mycoplasmataceae bacterium]|nr:MAG: hypothetical protein AM1032_000162 [Mycoplasmataceae bacterium]